MGGSRVAKALAVALFLCALSAALLVPRTVALADDSSVGAVGGSVHAIWTTNVRMAAETVQAVCFDYFAEYRVDFKFVNEGKARKVKLGFPFTDTVGGEEGTEPPVGFQAWQNGRPLTVRAVAARVTKSTTVGYFVHEAVFPHGATMITVSYLAGQGGVGEERRRRASVGHPGSGGLYQYWLHSGSTWKGPIGKAVVRYRLADSFRGSDIELAAADASRYAPLTSPPNWTRPLPRTYQWQFSDFEPKATPTSDWWKPQSPLAADVASRRPGRRDQGHGPLHGRPQASVRAGDHRTPDRRAGTTRGRVRGRFRHR